MFFSYLLSLLTNKKEHFSQTKTADLIYNQDNIKNINNRINNLIEAINSRNPERILNDSTLQHFSKLVPAEGINKFLNNLETQNLDKRNKKNIKKLIKRLKLDNLDNANNISSPVVNPKLMKEYFTKMKDSDKSNKMGNEEGILPELMNNKKIKKHNTNLEPINKPSCKFFSSYDDKAFVCPQQFKYHSGASFGSSGKNISCNGSNLTNKDGKLIAIMDKDSIKNVKIINPGGNYKSVPKIKVIGNGKLADLKCEIKNGQLTKINILNPGTNYTQTPKIKVIRPNDSFLYCHLCCRDKIDL